MRIKLIALLALLGTTGCGSLLRQTRLATHQDLSPGRIVSHVEYVDDDDDESDVVDDEPCQQLATPIFYGHYGTCWRQWPKGWTSCAHDAIEVSEAEVESPIPPAPSVEGSKESSSSGKTSINDRLAEVKSVRSDQEKVNPPKLFVVSEREHQSADDLLAQRVACRLGRMVQSRRLSQVTLHVKVMGDTAWVSGDIPTVAEKEVVLKAAEQTEGIRKVYHRLHVSASAGNKQLR